MFQVITLIDAIGDNVGSDEFSDDDFVSKFVFGLVEIFTARDIDNGGTKAYILIENSSHITTRGKLIHHNPR